MSNSFDEAKKDAGYRAAELVKDGMTVGLGTGSTVFYAMEHLSERIKSENLKILGIPTSIQTAMRAEEYGIPLTTLSLNPEIDIAIDGADQVNPSKQMIKGRGAALMREKITASSAKKFITVIDSSKETAQLNAAVPIEVLPFAYGFVCRKLRELKGEPILRCGVKKDGAVISDNGNFIIDCSFGEISDAEILENKINEIPGVLENGIFSKLTDKTEVIVGRR